MRYQTTCLRHAELAYQDQATVRQSLNTCGGELVAWFEDQTTGTAGYAAKLPSEISIIAFRGSEFDWNDWKTNLNRKPVMGLHNGFYNAISSIARHLRDAMKYHDPERTILLTGHSLGGAIATLAANELSENHLVNEVHTFGCPRVGDERFAKIYDATLGDVTYRHVNCCDIVPRLPSAWRYGYSHVGQEVYYDVWGDRSTNPSQLYKFCDRGLGRIHRGWKLPTRGISDHMLAAYRRVVK